MYELEMVREKRRESEASMIRRDSSVVSKEQPQGEKINKSVSSIPAFEAR